MACTSVLLRFANATHDRDINHALIIYLSKKDSMQTEVNCCCRQMRNVNIHNVTRSDNLWATVNIVVDSDTPTTVLETVGSAVYATIKANPKSYGGSYRVFWVDSLPGAKKEIGIFYDYSQNGTKSFLSHAYFLREP
jgi:hypothetical protein